MADPPIPTRYAILLALLREGPSRASDLVEPAGLTLQGVSYHLKQLASEGLVGFEGEDRKARLTPEGVQALHKHFQGLKAFVDFALQEMFHVEETVAVAGEDLDTGDEVGLFMEDGRLVARREQSPSRGTVARGASVGSPVVVSGLTGLVDLDPGTVHVILLPAPDRLPPAGELRRLVEERAIAWDLLALSGVEAEVLAQEADLLDGRELARFAPAHAARAAAQVGVDVLLVVSHENRQSALDTLRTATPETTGPLPVEEHELGAR